MPKDFFQDMVRVKRAEREKISAVAPAPVVKVVKKEEPKQPVESPEVNTKFVSVYDVMDDGMDDKGKPKSPRGKHTLWFVALASFIFFIFAVSFLFTGAKITVNPKIRDLPLDQIFSAVKDGSTEDLPFDLVVLSGEESKTIAGGEETDVVKRAEGTVLIYNAFSSANQRLDIDTRLEGSNGKIYKTKTSTIVPGMKGSTPGSVEVAIYGTEAGEAYNSAPLDFNIFGFKGTPKYEKFYARSKGEIAGGFKGKAISVSDTEKAAVATELKEALQTKLFKNATEQIPEGFILFKDATLLIITNETVGVTSKDGMVPLTEKGTLYGLLFEEKKLTQKITEALVPEYDGSEVYIPNIQNLTFSTTNRNVLATDVKSINFSLSGAPTIVWVVDEGKLVTDLLGKKKKTFEQILSQYVNISSADLALSPFWKMSLPTKEKSIKIIVNYPK